MNTPFHSIRAGMTRSVQYFEPRFFPFGLVAIVGFPLYYIVWHLLFPQPYENLPLRLLGSALFVPVMLAARWPPTWRRYLPLYWFLTTLYALPFFFTFMLLKNSGSIAWQLSELTAVFLMVLLLDWISLLVQVLLGAGCALLAFSLTTPDAHLVLPGMTYIPVYLFIIVLGAIANYSAEELRRERMRAMQTTASLIAHELRTPLLGIRAGASGLAQHLPTLLQAYDMARAAGLPVGPLRARHQSLMQGVLHRIEGEVNYSNIVIDMLLANARPFEFNKDKFTRCSIVQCLEIALRRYPFSSENERLLVSVEENTDFTFRGDELLMVHIVFNLLKNALRHIAQAGKGRITIRINPDHRPGSLIFRDTGPGIPAHVLPHIFTRFYSWTLGHDDGSGAGIGLAYCRSVMQSFGGNIVCESTPGEYTEFILTFPVVSD
jgi:signal transduction histidine kinase